MATAPLGESLVCKFAVFAKERIGEDRERHHVLPAHLADDVHEGLLIFQNIVDIVDDKGAVRELFAAEKRLKVVSVKDRKVGKGRLIDAEVGLVQLIDDALELLIAVILRAVDEIVAVAVLLPEIKRIDKEAGKATRRGRLCVSTKPDYILLLPLQ